VLYISFLQQSQLGVLFVTGKTEELPKKIKAIRQYLKLSQEGLAHKLGVSFTSVNRWENGQTKPSKLARKQLEALCKECSYEMPAIH
jgi:DNA-binding transcriptional regulator YiaG